MGDNGGVGNEQPHKGGTEEIEHAGRNISRKGSSLGASDLDRYRRYSMRVTVTSARRFLSEDDEILALGSPSTDHHESDSPAASSVQLPTGLESTDDTQPSPARSPGEYLGVPDELITGTSPTSHV